MNQLLTKAGIRKSSVKWKKQQEVKDLTNLFQSLKTEEAKQVEVSVCSGLSQEKVKFFRSRFGSDKLSESNKCDPRESYLLLRQCYRSSLT